MSGASHSLLLVDESALFELAQRLAVVSPRPLAIALQGPLGAGKTSFARALLRALGHAGPVRSPTYTLVEQYPLAEGSVWHMDLYRLATPEEVDWLGLDDFVAGSDWLLVEWPQRGADHLPQMDLSMSLDYADPGRQLQISALSEFGDLATKSVIANATDN